MNFELVSEKFVDHSKVKRVFVLGSANGSGNLGDEAMFEAVTGYLYKNYPHIKVTTDASRFPFESVYSNVDTIMPMYGSVTQYRTYVKLIEFFGLKFFGTFFILIWKFFFKKSELFRYLTEFKRCDYILFSGAGAINSRFRSYGIFGWGSLAFLAKAFGKKVFLSGHGIGPFSSKLHEYCAISYLKEVTYVKCRDEISFELLKKNGVKNLSWTIDDAYFIGKASDEEVGAILLQHGIKNKYFVLSFHKWNESFDYLKFKEIADYVIQNTDLDIILLGNKIKPTMDDIPVLNEFKDTYYNNNNRVVVLTPPYTPQVSKGIISKSEFLITTRYHPAIFSGEENIPCLALSFDKYYYQKFVGALSGRTNCENLLINNESFDGSVEFINRYL